MHSVRCCSIRSVLASSCLCSDISYNHRLCDHLGNKRGYMVAHSCRLLHPCGDVGRGDERGQGGQIWLWGPSLAQLPLQLRLLASKLFSSCILFLPFFFIQIPYRNLALALAGWVYRIFEGTPNEPSWNWIPLFLLTVSILTGLYQQSFVPSELSHLHPASTHTEYMESYCTCVKSDDCIYDRPHWYPTRYHQSLPCQFHPTGSNRLPL